MVYYNEVEIVIIVYIEEGGLCCMGSIGYVVSFCLFGEGVVLIIDI